MLEALLVSVSVPVYDCLSSGRKVTLSLQLLPAAKDAGQSPRVAVNTPPEVVTLEITSAPGPWFVICTLSCRLALVRCAPKDNEAGIDTRGPAAGGVVTAAPVPVRVVTVGLLEALLVSVRVPVYDCLSSGRKVTLSLQFLPAAKDAGQLPRVAVNTPPEVVTLLMTSAPGPWFVI